VIALVVLSFGCIGVLNFFEEGGRDAKETRSWIAAHRLSFFLECGKNNGEIEVETQWDRTGVYVQPLGSDTGHDVCAELLLARCRNMIVAARNG
jgi:hypothetical protein